MEWINCKNRKPEGEVFWALTQGRCEGRHRDWVIIKLLNCGFDEYRSLDYAGSYFFEGTYKGQCWQHTIFAWLPLNAILIKDEVYD